MKLITSLYVLIFFTFCLIIVAVIFNSQVLLWMGGIIFLAIILVKCSSKIKFQNSVYQNNLLINEKEVPIFRDIPCDGDIYYANVLVKLNHIGYNKTNIFGAIILKWIYEDKIILKNIKKGFLNKKIKVIELVDGVSFEYAVERKLFETMLDLSENRVLDIKKFFKWCKKNYHVMIELLDRFYVDMIFLLEYDGHLRYDDSNVKIMDDVMYKDSVELYGFKKYLQEFSRMNTKEFMEVKLWNKYLMFAYLLGIGKKMYNQLKRFSPEILEQVDFDYDAFELADYVSSTSSVILSNYEKTSIDGYSAGGGGFSSGGGGGGSFGGGGGGSR